MKYQRLGNTALEVSEVGLGTWALGGPVTHQGRSVGWRPIEEKEAINTIHAALDSGINFIDTADIYGKGLAENFIGKALKEAGPTGKKVLVATKGGFILDRDLPHGKNQDFSEAHIRQACEDSLNRLQRNVIDLYQLHCVPFPVIKDGKVFQILEALKKEGKIREYGVSIVHVNEALLALEHPGVKSIQIIFNIFRQKPSHEFFPMAEKKGVGILARVPLASGLLTGKFKSGHKFEPGDHRSGGIPGETFSGVAFEEGLKVVDELKPLIKPGERTLAQAALAYTLNYPAVSSTIPGAVTAAQIKENAKASDLPPLSKEDLQLCQALYEKHFKSKMEKSY